MDQTFLSNLPSELIIDILSRLPIKTIVRCKCVSKLWSQLLQTPEFTNSHLSKTLPGLVVYRDQMDSELLAIFEFSEEIGLDRHELHYIPVTEFDANALITPLHCSRSIQGSVNGLLFLREVNVRPNVLYICNPITRDYIILPRIEGIFQYPSIVTYGFGISKTSRQYKVVRILHERNLEPDTNSLLSVPKSECLVYTIGTCSWRSVTFDNSHEYNCRSNGTFCNGNLHWLVRDLKGTHLISCFDLEKERFRMFSPPHYLTVTGSSRSFLSCLTILDDRLCVCDSSSENEIVVWIMKEYGEEKSWTKEFVIKKDPDLAGECYEVVYPLKVFEDGDILMSWDDFYLFHYSRRTKSTPIVDLFELLPGSIDTTLHVPSFVSLKSFVMEKVNSF